MYVKMVLDYPGKGCDWRCPPDNVFEGSALNPDEVILRECHFYTEITHDGSAYEGRDDRCWEAEVFTYFGAWKVRLPALDRKLTRLELFTLMMDAGPGEGDAWLENILCEEDYEYVKRNYYSRAEA